MRCMKNKKYNALGAINYYLSTCELIKLGKDLNINIRACKMPRASDRLLSLLLLPIRLPLIYFLSFIKSSRRIHTQRINVPGTAHGKMYKRGHV